MARYQVTGECAHIVVDSPEGPVTQLVYKGTILPDGVPAARLRHLLDLNLIRDVGSNPIAPAAPAPNVQDPNEVAAAGGPTEPSETPANPTSEAKPFDDPERVAAREKLPTDGSLPDGRAAHAVWVEAAVAKGYAYEAASSTEKPELIALLRK